MTLKNKGRAPIQAADYGKDKPSLPLTKETPKPKAKGKSQTDGQKTLSLWSN